jgi:predicted alpha/beta-fold hydrolase
MKTKLDDFKPAWWLNSGHLQTIFPAIFRRNIPLRTTRERLELPDGDFLDLDWIGENPDEIVLILPGLAGSIASHYVQGMMNTVFHHNRTAVIMHFRGCSGEPNRLARSYHSGETQDFSYVIKIIKNRYPAARLSVIGYSLGGNVLLKWLGESITTDMINAAVAISAPFDLSKVVDRIQTGFSKIYQRQLLNQLIQQILKKRHLVEPIVDCSLLIKVKNFREFDSMVTAPLHGFKDAEDYYRSSSCRQFLKGITVPTLIINALDDPFMTSDCIPHTKELSEKIKLELYQSGGHIGFISASKFHKPWYWLEGRISDYLKLGNCKREW